ncbi:MAG: hypothetical protein Kow00128_07060 [Deltaproteobacteria bacterium]
MKMRILLPLVLLPVLACAFACPLRAGEERRATTVYSDRRGNEGWIVTERSGDRMRATPYFHVSGETARRAMGMELPGPDPDEVVAALPPTPPPETPALSSRQRREAIASLLSGPEGVSLGRILDLAHRASDSARETLRGLRQEVRNPRTP